MITLEDVKAQEIVQQLRDSSEFLFESYHTTRNVEYVNEAASAIAQSNRLTTRILEEQEEYGIQEVEGH